MTALLLSANLNFPWQEKNSFEKILSKQYSRFESVMSAYARNLSRISSSSLFSICLSRSIVVIAVVLFVVGNVVVGTVLLLLVLLLLLLQPMLYLLLLLLLFRKAGKIELYTLNENIDRLNPKSFFVLFLVKPYFIFLLTFFIRCCCYCCCLLLASEKMPIT